MKKSILAVAAVAVVAVVTVAAPTQAEARRGNAVAAGVIGGLAAGAIIGSAAAAPYGYYPGYVGYPAPVYAPGPAYYGPPPGCVIRNQRVWDGYAWRRQKIRVCH